jgi:hypothetical protein
MSSRSRLRNNGNVQAKNRRNLRCTKVEGKNTKDEHHVIANERERGGDLLKLLCEEIDKTIRIQLSGR